MKQKNLKHQMLVEAKRIANTEFKGTRKYYIPMNDSIKDVEVPPNILKEEEIRRTLFDNPKFNEDEFKRMIKTFEHKDKVNEEE